MHFPPSVQQRLAREPIDEQEDTVVSCQAAIAAGHREAGDSFDFHARHGRALQARAARESMQGLLTLFRSWRRRRATARQAWHVDWPSGPQTSHSGRP
jgi:hypothetical protein